MRRAFQRILRILGWAYLSAIALSLVVVFFVPLVFGQKGMEIFLGSPLGFAVAALLVFTAMYGCGVATVLVPLVLLYIVTGRYERDERRFKRLVHFRLLREMYGPRDRDEETTE